MAIKRKAVTAASGKGFVGALTKSNPKAEEDPEAAEPHEEEEEENEGEEVSEEQRLEEQEREEAARRTKELKGMAVDQVKALVADFGLETGKKADMIESVVAHEAKLRADKRAHAAKLRAVVVRKKGELEALSMSDLSKLCVAGGTKAMMSKQARVQLLLKQWQEDDGVDKAMRQMARDERRQVLEAMDKVALRALCEQVGLDPIVVEVAADRVCGRERELGRYLRPARPQDGSADAAKEGGKDMVSELLESEANRKKEKEARRSREEAAAQKRKELRAWSVDDLKKALAKRGHEASGKKDDMVEALFELTAQEDAVAARRASLKALGTQELKDMATGLGLEVGAKEKMLDGILAREAQLREEARAFDKKAAEVAAQKKEQLEGKTLAELKELLEGKDLKTGGTKEEKIERLVVDLQKSGGIDADVAKAVQQERRAVLGAMPREELLELCGKLGADPLVKEVMIERILAHEEEFGTILAAEGPAAKKARTKK